MCSALLKARTVSIVVLFKSQLPNL